MANVRYIGGGVRRGKLLLGSPSTIGEILRMNGTSDKLLLPISDKLLLTIPEAMAVTNLGRTMVYRLIGNGALESVKVGRKRLIPTAAATDWVEQLRRKCSGQV